MAENFPDKSDGASVNSDLRPPSRMVNEFHTHDDLNRDSDAHHHSLGIGVNQASSGAHNHNGTNSELLLKGFTLTGARGTATAIVSIIDALEQLGATDSTTA